MGRTTRYQQILYLDHDKAALLKKLHSDTRVATQVLLREAVDDLLVKYKLLKPNHKP